MWSPAARCAKLFKLPGLPAAWPPRLLITLVFSLVFISFCRAGRGTGEDVEGGGNGELRTRNALHMHCAFATVLCTLCCNVFHCFQFFFPSFFVTPVLCVRSCVVYFVCSAGQQTKLLVLFLLNFVFFLADAFDSFLFSLGLRQHSKA